MMKTLADAGLIHYEPYNGVRLTTAARNWRPTCCGVTG